MRVGVISPEFPPEIGGIQTYAYQFVSELARRGHEVRVFTRPHPEGEIPMAGVEIIPVLRLRRVLDRDILRDRAIDVWHVMNAAYAWVALEAAHVLVSVHGNDFLQPYIPVAQPNLERFPGLWRSTRWRPAVEEALGRCLTSWSVRHALPKATQILANSRYTERVLLEQYPRCRGITSAAMVGVAPDFLETPLARGPLGFHNLITVCRLAEQRKNVALVLQALARLKSRHNFAYTVIGDGPLRPGLEKLALDLGLHDRVRFTGFIRGADMRNFLLRSDLFILTSSIHPSSHEGFGIAYLEANACGTPVLAARLAGAIEAVEECVSGLFIDAADVASITAALEAFFSGAISFDSAQCRAFAEQMTWSRVVDCAMKFYPDQTEFRAVPILHQARRRPLRDD